MRYKRKQNIRKWAERIPDLDIKDLSTPKLQKYIRETNYAAAYKYSRKQYPGKVTLLRSDKRSVGEYDRESLGWKQFAEDVDVRVIPGNHITLLEEPNVKVLAGKLQNCINLYLRE